jgi:phytoene dehydrogenase-like protein
MTISQTPVPAAVDGIIIGGGHNGLIAANYLARAGAQVLVLESQARIGGGLSTEEITLPLFKHNLHAYFVRWTPNYRIWDDLELSRYGMNTLVPEVQNVVPLRSGGALISYNSLERSLAAIREFSPRDAETYARVYAEFEAIVQQIVDPLRFAAPLPAGELEMLLSRSKLGRRYLELTRYAAFDLVCELFEHEAVRALVLFNVAIRAYLPVLDVPGTGYIVPLALFGSHHGAMVLGGSYQAAQALAAGVFDHGGMVVTKAKVERILVEQGRATGVELSDGRRVQARRFICSNVPSALTLTRMIEPQHLDSGLREAVSAYRWNDEALFGVHLALREPIRYGQSDPEDPINHSLNYCVGYETSADFIRDMEWIRRRTIPIEPALHIGSPTVFDPNQAPPGCGTAFAWQFVPTRPAAGGPDIWDESETEAFGELMVKKWSEYAPNLAGAEIARGLHSPLDTVRHVPSMVLGDRHHGSYHPDNFDANRPHPSLSNYRTPITGLYHCGSDSYPGGSFTGQPAYNAVTTIARDLGYEIWWNPKEPGEVLPEV